MYQDGKPIGLGDVGQAKPPDTNVQDSARALPDVEAEEIERDRENSARRDAFGIWLRSLFNNFYMDLAHGGKSTYEQFSSQYGSDSKEDGENLPYRNALREEMTKHNMTIEEAGKFLADYNGYSYEFTAEKETMLRAIAVGKMVPIYEAMQKRGFTIEKITS